MFQQGREGYAGTWDSFLNGWSPDANHSVYNMMWLRSGEWMQPVLRFDLSTVPADARVASATLSLYVNSSSNSYSVEVRAYRLNRPWAVSEVTWNQAANGQPWGQAGANEAGTDRAWEYAAQCALAGTGAWLELDLTALVQNWVNAPDQNYGLVLKGIGAAGVRYDLLASEFWNVALRPKLAVTYQSP